MKMLLFILCLFSAGILALLALVFVAIEGILLVSLDFLLYESVFLAFFQLLLKLFVGVLVFLLGLFSIIRKRYPFVWEGLALLLATLVASPFISNGFGLYFSIAAAFFLLAHLLFKLFGQKKNAKTEKSLP